MVCALYGCHFRCINVFGIKHLLDNFILSLASCIVVSFGQYAKKMDFLQLETNLHLKGIKSRMTLTGFYLWLKNCLSSSRSLALSDSTTDHNTHQTFFWSLRFNTNVECILKSICKAQYYETFEAHIVYIHSSLLPFAGALLHVTATCSSVEQCETADRNDIKHCFIARLTDSESLMKQLLICLWLFIFNVNVLLLKKRVLQCVRVCVVKLIMLTQSSGINWSGCLQVLPSAALWCSHNSFIKIFIHPWSSQWAHPSINWDEHCS